MKFSRIELNGKGNRKPKKTVRSIKATKKARAQKYRRNINRRSAALPPYLR
jgi:hypothetical protein